MGVAIAPGHFWQQHDCFGCLGSLRHHQEEPTHSSWFSNYSGQWRSGGILPKKKKGSLVIVWPHPLSLLPLVLPVEQYCYFPHWGTKVPGPLIASLSPLRDGKACGKVSSEICQVTSEGLKSNSPLVVRFFLHFGLVLLANLQASQGWCGSRSFTIWVPICFSTSEKKEAQGVLSGTDWPSENQTTSLAWLLIRSEETHCI